MCYNESTKERSDRIDSKEKAVFQIVLIICGIMMLCYGALRGRGRNRVKQGNPAVFGVCGIG